MDYIDYDYEIEKRLHPENFSMSDFTTGEVSNCCGAAIYEDGICAQCKEGCGVMEGGE